MQARNSIYHAFIVLTLCAGLTLAGCVRSATSTTPFPDGDVQFLPPTLSPVTPTPDLAQTEAAAVPTPTLECSNQLIFLEDLTIPDGTVVAPGSTMDKRWSVENSGTCNWDDRYSLRLVSGPEMGVDAQQMIFPALSGSQAEIRIVFTAPSDPGTYRSAWQAYAPDDQPFGDPFYIEVVVEPAS
ncbi:MAG: hypothetical protein GYA17_21920 [Chloroflexi bacterium]|nr:hypothetical protein [Chloroflexota bacterium]